MAARPSGMPAVAIDEDDGAVFVKSPPEPDEAAKRAAVAAAAPATLQADRARA